MKTTHDKLIEKGFKHEVFFYQIGGGEDENNMQIYQHGIIAVTYDFYKKEFMKCDYDRIGFVEGWDYDNETVFDINTI